MKKQWIVVAAAIVMILTGVPQTAAQGPGPQGAGSEKAAKSSEPSSHSYNPIKWMKKSPSTKTAKTKKPKTENVRTKNAKNKKPSEKSALPGTPVKPLQA